MTTLPTAEGLLMPLNDGGAFGEVCELKVGGTQGGMAKASTPWTRP